MFKFYRKQSNQFADWVEEKLNEMVVAHKLIDMNGNNPLPEGITQEDLPALSDGYKTWLSESEIKKFLRELDQDLSFSRSLSGDACYIDPDNPDQCL
jgi:hypothetical protein